MEASKLMKCIITGKQIKSFCCDDTKSLRAMVGPAMDNYQAPTHLWKFCARDDYSLMSDWPIILR